MAIGYETSDDPYLYKNTNVLKNKLGLRDPAQLEAFELEMTTLRSKEPLPAGSFDAAHYCSIHRHLFQDVYRWAGKYRSLRTFKGGNAFCYPEYIERAMDKLFQTLSRTLDASDEDIFIQEVAQFLAELNAIHPFREGNGRSQLSFLSMIAERAGFPFDLSKLSPGPFMAAMITSFGGDLAALINELRGLRMSRRPSSDTLLCNSD